MKMSNEKFRVIVLPIVAIIVVLMIVLSMAADSATLWTRTTYRKKLPNITT